MREYAQVEIRAARAETNFGGVDSEPSDKLFFAISEQLEECMILRFETQNLS